MRGNLTFSDLNGLLMLPQAFLPRSNSLQYHTPLIEGAVAEKYLEGWKPIACLPALTEQQQVHGNVQSPGNADQGQQTGFWVALSI